MIPNRIGSRLIMLISLLLFCLGCEHRPLEDIVPVGNLFLRVYFDENIRNVTYGFYDETKKRPEYHSPQMMRVVFCDEQSDRVVTERYLSDYGEDERGYYIQGLVAVPDGRYNMIAYNFDTKETRIENENHYSAMRAYTAPLSESEVKRIFSTRSDNGNTEEVICRQPDHLFVARMEGVEVNTSQEVGPPDTIVSELGISPVAESIVKTYYLQFNVKGVEYVRSAVALISGMAGSKIVHNGEMVHDDVASIYFGLNNGKEKNRTTADGVEDAEVAVAYASFNTFGKLPYTEGYIEIVFEFNTIYNTVQTETFRVTDMFETDIVKEKQWIIIDKVIEIVPPEDVEVGGGMAPGVSDWEEIESAIII